MFLAYEDWMLFEASGEFANGAVPNRATLGYVIVEKHFLKQPSRGHAFGESLCGVVKA
jgi:hypothetical protein